MFQAVKETKTALKSSRYQECTVVNQWWTDTYIVKTFPAVPYLSLLVSYFDATHLDTHRRESETDRMILLEQQRNCRNWSWRCIEPCAGNQWRVWLESILVYISNIINMFVWILKTCFKVVSSFEKPNWTVQSFFQIGAVSVCGNRWWRRNQRWLKTSLTWLRCQCCNIGDTSGPLSNAEQARNMVEKEISRVQGQHDSVEQEARVFWWVFFPGVALLKT